MNIKENNVLLVKWKLMGFVLLFGLASACGLPSGEQEGEGLATKQSELRVCKKRKKWKNWKKRAKKRFKRRYLRRKCKKRNRVLCPGKKLRFSLKRLCKKWKCNPRKIAKRYKTRLFARYCVDPMKDPRHCGACGNRCQKGAKCIRGKCVSRCAAGESTCGRVCVDTSQDTSNCGACGNRCKTGESCVEGTCSACPPGESPCDGYCMNYQINPGHCGACGFRCESDESCVQGHCTKTCKDNEVYCNGFCIPSTVTCGKCTLKYSPPSGTPIKAGQNVTISFQESIPIFYYAVGHYPASADAGYDENFSASGLDINTSAFKSGETVHVKIARVGGEECLLAYPVK